MCQNTNNSNKIKRPPTTKIGNTRSYCFCYVFSANFLPCQNNLFCPFQDNSICLLSFETIQVRNSWLYSVELLIQNHYILCKHLFYSAYSTAFSWFLSTFCRRKSCSTMSKTNQHKKNNGTYSFTR